jgi:hypothetical protein
VSEGQLRCTECGHGSSYTTLTALAAPVELTPEAVRVRDETARERAAGAMSGFAGASFSPLGLDDRWLGLRWFGGWSSSHDQVDSLELAFADHPTDENEPTVRVTTHGPGAEAHIVRWMEARHLVEYVWRETDVLSDDVRRAAFDRSRIDGALEPWEPIEFAIDRQPAPFRVLEQDDVWVALGRWRSQVVAIRARRWPAQDTGLVTVEDFAPYAEGHVEIIRRRSGPPDSLT